MCTSLHPSIFPGQGHTIQLHQMVSLSKRYHPHSAHMSGSPSTPLLWSLKLLIPSGSPCRPAHADCYRIVQGTVLFTIFIIQHDILRFLHQIQKKTQAEPQDPPYNCFVINRISFSRASLLSHGSLEFSLLLTGIDSYYFFLREFLKWLVTSLTLPGISEKQGVLILSAHLPLKSPSGLPDIPLSHSARRQNHWR